MDLEEVELLIEIYCEPSKIWWLKSLFQYLMFNVHSRLKRLFGSSIKNKLNLEDILIEIYCEPSVRFGG